VYVGDDTVTLTTGLELVPGEALELPYMNMSGEPLSDIRPAELYVIGTSGDRVSWFATRR
jgi:hypothetical protein